MLLDDLVGVIKTLKERIATHGPSLRENETRTRMALIDPLLQSLGWDTSDPSLVTPEYDLSGQKADYGLLSVDHKPMALVEAKRLGESLVSHRMQMVNYANMSGVAYAGLTDGNIWELYKVFDPSPIAERKILDLSIADTPTHEVALKLLLLWRPNLASGQPVAANSPVLDATANQTTELALSSSVLLSPPHYAQPSNPKSGMWTPLSQVEKVSGRQHPTEIKFSNGQLFPIRTWKDILLYITEWLVQIGSLKANNLPILGMGFINKSPYGPRGNPYGVVEEVTGGIYVNVKLSAKDIVKNSTRLLDHFDVNPETVELRFE